ncbi:30S ribosomal protein S13 [Sulfurisphaera tokodaii]|uniref:Small ribosomal subunit protein uS13 n=2 Tax=Sulfurisphaera tokodaii TaxID=111955 RepID=RS13_SULTO|nr:30S ribosomal protein S13 [Sulfurisphaera tokodaii]Q96YV7.1 RecName: Full=Small ribosomal subunit protein uS13; AltName: Full=30S ribosomal protein S13 [Sulfurisphaera tokodaii str. 7]BAB67169.1 30S ribosomal protein S13P [Sulfurisphaera tokodaii str. 7]HII72901.1 30S ribosomal protein S13 [Sulfurisphaera tokodaii]
MSQQQQFKYIVRLFGQDVDGTMKVPYALAMVKGIGYNTARAIVFKLGLDKDRRLGELSDEDIKKIENYLTDKKILEVPNWMYNRRKDYESGIDMHLVTSDLIFYVRNDIEREKKIKSWRGVRHSLGLKVRGQRTRTTGRTGVTVGVRRSKAAQAAQQQQKAQASSGGEKKQG